MNIYQRIAEVQKACANVTKDTEVGYGNNRYKAVSHDGVLTVLRQPLIDNGIVVMVSQQAKGLSVPGKTQNDNDKVRFEAVYDVSFISVETPEDRHTVAVEAHGEDSNDKGPGKAISYATKTAMLKTFLLVTGENDEKRLDDGPDEPRQYPETGKLATEPQCKMLSAKMKANKVPTEAVFKKFGVTRLGEITMSKVNDVVEYIEGGYAQELINKEIIEKPGGLSGSEPF